MKGFNWFDIAVFIIYMAGMLGIGIYFLRKNKSGEDYYVGGRSMSSGHVGLSVVATDVGGGFSIGLGGLGFAMGISGSWMLFTGILGAWISTVVLIPKVFPLGKKHQWVSFPQVLEFYYNKQVALLAGVISFIGYVGFTSSQLLAGAKLATAAFPEFNIQDAVLVMGIIAVVYTVAGGLKAVIYTDTVQWVFLMGGLMFIGIPLGYYHLGGWSHIRTNLPEHYLSLTNIRPIQFINWIITIVPIWFIGMTLYQRIFACKDEKTAIRAWRIAGLFEWPVMAFLGVILGVFANLALQQGLFANIGYNTDVPIDPEIGLPLFLRNILPAGLLGLMLSAYFSAIMSTADSCLMAASGNLVTDIIQPFRKNSTGNIRLSQIATLLIGMVSIFLAMQMREVLTLMLHSYAIMVSGLLVPVFMMLYHKAPSSWAALSSMIAGGGVTLVLTVSAISLPLGLEPIFFGLVSSFVMYWITIKGRGFLVRLQ